MLIRSLVLPCALRVIANYGKNVGFKMEYSFSPFEIDSPTRNRNIELFCNLCL